MTATLIRADARHIPLPDASVDPSEARGQVLHGELVRMCTCGHRYDFHKKRENV